VKRKLCAVGIGFHFFFILSVATHLHEWMSKWVILAPITALTDYYTAITFANRDFGFFAPEVTSDWNTRFTLTDTKGGKRPYAFSLPTREMQVKMYSMLGHFTESDDLFARSWALRVMNENQDVEQVDVEITQNYIPTMEGYRRGQRIAPHLIYRTTFNLH
jgi:hypothetical protein